ncbi:MAG TPA: hypothetical protein VE262_14010 [Blastocatellia bacterium]|nr:hypothetical protein [Blastocatellia bacterium]
MNKKHTAWKNRSGAFSNLRGKPSSARSWMLALVLLIGPAAHSPAAYAQPSCFYQCQQELLRCMDESENNPPSQALCQDNYDTCAEACMGMIRG